MSNCLEGFLSFCGDVSKSYLSTQVQGAKAKEILSKVLDLSNDVLIEEFLEMYDTRIYDVHNKQNDLKFMKDVDFAGVYILRNKSKNKCYVGKANKVFRKIERQFKGHENPVIFEEWQQGNIFFVNIVGFKNSGYENIDLLEKAVKGQYNSCV